MSETIKFTLDGVEVEAAPGETIWQVAKRQGTLIPHLCHKDAPGYRSDGNCRACMVEIDGERVLAASCVRAPTDGMAVTSQSDRADKARKMVIEMLVADQPARETAHDKSSHLWDMADLQGVAFRCWMTATSPCGSIWMPASTATSVCAPAARSRSTT
jgi:formate dehydrogenase major subunit